MGACGGDVARGTVVRAVHYTTTALLLVHTPPHSTNAPSRMTRERDANRTERSMHQTYWGWGGTCRGTSGHHYQRDPTLIRR